MALIKNIHGHIIDKCIVCGNEFANPGNNPDMVFLCSSECSKEFKNPEKKEIIKELYKKQFLKRTEEQKKEFIKVLINNYGISDPKAIMNNIKKEAQLKGDKNV